MMARSGLVSTLPYPELVETAAHPQSYEIHDSGDNPGAPSLGMVDKVERVMLVPLTRDGLAVRRHELAHVRWSPNKLPKVSYEPLILLAAEDARINLALERRGLPVRFPERLRAHALRLAEGDLQEENQAGYVLRTLASLGTDMRAPLVAVSAKRAPAAHATVLELGEFLRESLESSRLRTRAQAIATFAAAMTAAAEIARRLGERGMVLSQRARLRFLISGGGFCASCDVSEEERRLSWRVRRSGGYGGPEDREAARMRIEEPPRPLAYPASGHGALALRRHRQGAIIRHPNRWFSDKAIFRRRVSHYGGSVLIDTSSSMRLNAAGVDAIMRRAPSATLVAIYSGQAREGELRIVARDGRRVAASGLAPFGPGNLIDLPALEWLATQPAPRIWVSDGLVTGQNDWASRYLGRRCRVVCQRNGIRRVETAEDAAAALAGRPARRLPIIPDWRR